jgi:hypothetical protein
MRQPPEPILHFASPLTRLFLLNPIALRSVSPGHLLLFIAAVPFLVKPFAQSRVGVISDHLPGADRIGGESPNGLTLPSFSPPRRGSAPRRSPHQAMMM